MFKIFISQKFHDQLVDALNNYSKNYMITNKIKPLEINGILYAQYFISNPTLYINTIKLIFPNSPEGSNKIIIPIICAIEQRNFNYIEHYSIGISDFYKKFS